MRILAAAGSALALGAFTFGVLISTAESKNSLSPGAYRIHLTGLLLRHTHHGEVYALYNRPAYPDRIGTGFVNCAPIGQFEDCAVALRLTRGQIVGRAVIARLATFRVFAITGGIGLYANVGGVLTIEPLTGQDTLVLADIQAY